MKPPNHGMRVRVTSGAHSYWGRVVYQPSMIGRPRGDDTHCGLGLIESCKWVPTMPLAIWTTDRIEVLR